MYSVSEQLIEIAVAEAEHYCCNKNKIKTIYSMWELFIMVDLFLWEHIIL